MSDPIPVAGHEVAQVEIPKLILLSNFLPRFKIGTTVRLKSGGPPMTVTAAEGLHVEAQWFEGTEAKQKIYPVAALQEVQKRRKVHV